MDKLSTLWDWLSTEFVLAVFAVLCQTWTQRLNDIEPACGLHVPLLSDCRSAYDQYDP